MIGTNDLGAAACAGQQAITDAAAGTTERSLNLQNESLEAVFEGRIGHQLQPQ